MAKIITIAATDLAGAAWSEQDQQRAVSALEAGGVVLVPGLSLDLLPQEQALFDPAAQIADGISKNITLDPLLGKISGIDANSPYRPRVEALLHRYKQTSASWLQRLLGPQGARFEPKRTTFRPIEIRDRETVAKAAAAGAYRYDDTLLHVDAFKKRPMGERRIFRVFSNLNPYGEPRVWKVGDDFEKYARRFFGRIRRPLPGELALQQIFGATRWKRRRFDHIMLNLHDMGKLDSEFQNDPAHALFAFPPNCTWMCFTDHVLHAALSGRYAVEQTFELDYRDMLAPEKSPQMVLQRIAGSKIV
ncbi:MAG: hypothetical protein K0S54_2483 [Alphaproteobacteria bacterium]|jgi:hypothetical protein|nr:hypothetical protein [Alphaproteobacteria bacterium]